MDFTFLYDAPRDLFAIGYRPVEGTLDTGHYDLLASEARLASFVAIARGDVPVEHWFHLGRPLTPVGRGSALLSWSGSMFEYLMPDLVLDAPSGSLLEHTNRLIVRRQIRYGEERGVPWGISEAAYNARDMNFTYQYSNFGVSGLGLKRGLSEDLVVAPYATALAAMVDPAAAGANFRRLASVGALGRYGFYESIDYTASRLPEEETREVVKAYMAHHQGMTIVSLANVLLDETMRRRFRAEPAVQATELLLQERTPTTVAVARTVSEDARTDLHVQDEVPPVLRRFRSPHDPTPRTHLLSNGRYSVMMTAAGSGYSRWRGLDVTRWREDATRDPWGTYVFLADATSGKVWSAGYQPAGVEPDAYEAVYSEDRIEIHRTDGPIATTLQVVVSTEDDAEIRQVSLTNRGTRPREIEVTSYAEIVLAPAGRRRRASRLLESLRGDGVRRGPRGPRGRAPAARPRGARLGRPGDDRRGRDGRHRPVRDGPGALSRARDASVRDPISIAERRPLSNTAGTVLDPVFSLRRRVRLAPGATVRVHLATVVADSREAVLALAAKYRDPATFERVSSLAWTQAQVQLRHLGISTDEAHLFQQLATRILYSDAALRAPRRDPAAQPPGALGPLGARHLGRRSDRARADRPGRGPGHRAAAAARPRVLEDEGPRRRPRDRERAAAVLFPRARRHARVAGARGQPRPGWPASRPPGASSCCAAALASPEDRDALAAAARVVLLSRQGTLAQQVIRLLRRVPAARAAQPVAARPPAAAAAAAADSARVLQRHRGLLGGQRANTSRSSANGSGRPAPWINVLANASFGCLVSESGSGYTWAVNSRENQLTPWSNDPVSDPPGEALFLRDEETGEVWSPTPLPIRGDGSYVVRHGQGYSRFEYEHQGIATDLTVFVAPEDPGQDLAAARREPVRVGAQPHRHRLRGVGARAAAGGRRAVRRDGARLRDRRDLRAQRLERGPGRARRLRRRRAAAPDRLDGRPHASSSGATAASRPRRAWRAAPSFRGARAPDSIPAPRCRCGCACSRGSARRSSFLLGQGRDADEARQLVARHRAQDPEARARPPCGASGRTRSRRSRSARPTVRWT